MSRTVDSLLALILPLMLLMSTNVYAERAVTLEDWEGIFHGNLIVGYAFETTETISITALGKYDFDTLGLGENATVGIWDDATEALIVSATVPAGTEGMFDHGAYYTPVNQTILLPGRYVVGVQTFRYGESYTYEATITTGIGINWLEGRFKFGNDLLYPIIAHHDSGSYFGPDFIYNVVPENSILVTSLSERQVLQRNEQNKSILPVEGIITAESALIEARAEPIAGFPGYATSWTLVDDTIENGIFSGMLELASGWYSIELRGMDADSHETASVTIDHVGVGEVFITSGQSNSANYGYPRQFPDHDCISARQSVSINKWQKADDPQPTATGVEGSPWPELGDLIFERTCVPVGFVSVGVGGSLVEEWVPGTANYDYLINPTIFSLMDNGGFRAILWHQGESDSIAGTGSAEYASRLQQSIFQSRIDAGWYVPWGVGLVSYHPDSTAAQQAEIIAGQQSVIDEDPDVFQGAFTDDFHLLNFLYDDVHFNQEGLDEHADRWLTSILTAFGSEMMPGDFDVDGDVDGLDIVNFFSYQETSELEAFADIFGKINCTAFNN